MSGASMPVPTYQIDSQKLSFGAMGDWGTDVTAKNMNLRTLDRESAIHSTSYSLLLGDNFYEDGVRSLSDTLWNDVLENPFSTTSHIKDSLLHVILGNHDWRGDVNLQVNYKSAKSLNWNLPEIFYSNVYQFDRKDGKGKVNVLNIFIETTVWVDAEIAKDAGREELIEKQKKFVVDTLAAGAQFADYIFVSGHHGIFSVGAHGGYEPLRDFLRPLFYEYGVDAYFCGHDHSLQIFADSGKDLKHLVDVSTLSSFAEAGKSFVVPRSKKDREVDVHYSRDYFFSNILTMASQVVSTSTSTHRNTVELQELLKSISTSAQRPARRRLSGSADGKVKVDVVSGGAIKLDIATVQPKLSLKKMSNISEDATVGHFDVFTQDAEFSSTEDSEEAEEGLSLEQKRAVELYKHISLFLSEMHPSDQESSTLHKILSALSTYIPELEFPLIDTPESIFPHSDRAARVLPAPEQSDQDVARGNFLHPTMFFLIGSGGKRDYLNLKVSSDLLYAAQAFGTGIVDVFDDLYRVEYTGARGNRLVTAERTRHPFRSCIKLNGKLPSQSALLSVCGALEEQEARGVTAEEWSRQLTGKDISALLPQIPLLGDKWIRPAKEAVEKKNVVVNEEEMIRM
eukprot:GDKK01028917.1.p1 GENE.GDKK01028917.1~~GDKK01028917.1.p1  ORF type:complete len:636 (+),score=159.28 GDKK01028917.1:34-1908(+)